MSNEESLHDLLSGIRRMLEDQWLEPLEVILGTTKLSRDQIKTHLHKRLDKPTTRKISAELASAVLTANASKQHLKKALEELAKME